MRYNSDILEADFIKQAAAAMAGAARTAPKARGIDNIVTLVLDAEDKTALAGIMRKQADERGWQFFKRDADCIDKAQGLLLIAVMDNPAGLNGCGLCGAANCSDNEFGCAFNFTDLGIAVGSAVSIAAEWRVDNRVLYSAGIAAVQSGVFDEDVKAAYAIPLAAYGKNIFFDR